jgi:hypothetical protein
MLIFLPGEEQKDSPGNELNKTPPATLVAGGVAKKALLFLALLGDFFRLLGYLFLGHLFFEKRCRK